MKLGKPIIPILLRPCQYQYNPNLSNTRPLPKHPNVAQPKPISQWDNEDDAIDAVVTGLETIIQVNEKNTKPDFHYFETISTKIDTLLRHYYKKIDKDRLKRFDVDPFVEPQLINVEKKYFNELMLTAKEEGYINWDKIVKFYLR